MIRKILILAALLYSVSNFADPYHAPQDPNIKGDEKIEDISEIASCPFLERRRDIGFVPKNWALIASGANHLRKIPEVATAHYGKIAVIGTGLRIRGNPDAGDKLKKADLASDDDGHETHVIGIISSEKYGVNPYLTVLPLVGEYTQGDEKTSIVQKSLIEQLKVAIADPEVHTISISISNGESPELERTIQQAIDAGKWVVTGGGNDDTANSHRSTGLQAFRNNDSFFAAGAYSFFGAPSSFSNPSKYYTPGSEVDSLNSRYSPTALETKTSESMSGTSMATPHLAAVLETIHGLAPDAQPGQVHSLIQRSIIRRGDSPSFLQVNDGFVGKLAVAAQKQRCFAKGKGDAFESCLVEAEKEASASARLPTRPVGKICKEWEDYYDELTAGYFATNGSATFGDAVTQFFHDLKKPRWAENYFFTPASRKVPALHSSGLPYAQLHDDFDELQVFHHGKKKNRNQGLLFRPHGPTAETLEKLPPTPQNLLKVMKLCSDFLYEAPESQRDGACAYYLMSAPQWFRLKVAEKLIDANRPIRDFKIVACLLEKKNPYILNWGIAQGTGELEQPDHKDKALALFKLVIQGFDTNVNDEKARKKIYDSIRDLPDRVQWMDEATRVSLLKAVRKFEAEEWQLKNFSEEDAKIAAWTKLVSGSEEEKKTKSLLGNLAFTAKQYRAGHVPLEYLVREIEAGSKDSNPNQDVVEAIREDPKVFEKLIERVSREHDVEPYWPYLSVLMDKASPEASEAILTKVLKTYGNNPNTFWLYWLLHSKNSVVSNLVNDLLSKKQTDSTRQKMRIELLKQRFSEAKKASPEFNALFEEEPNLVRSVAMYYERPANLVLDTPALHARFQQILDRLENPVTSEYSGEGKETPEDDKKYHKGDAELVLHTLNGLDDHHFASMTAPLAQSFKTLVIRPEFVKADEVTRFVERVADLHGDDDRVIGTLLESTKDLFRSPLADKKWETGDRSSRDEQGRGAFLYFAQVLGNSKAGDRYLRAHPELLKEITERMAKIRSNYDDLMGHHFLRRETPLAPVFQAELEKRLAPVGEKMGFYYLSGWVRKLAERSSVTRARMVEQLEWLKDHAGERDTKDFRKELFDLAVADSAIARELYRQTKDSQLKKQLADILN
jgi:hypothetical protein